ncbi:unnamed protein product [Closterium sp. NIES-53]
MVSERLRSLGPPPAALRAALPRPIARRPLPLGPSPRPVTPRPVATARPSPLGWPVAPSTARIGNRDVEGCDKEVLGNGGSCRGVGAVKPVAPVARETVAPVAREPIAPVARESVAPAARLAAEPVTPVAHVPVAPFASVPIAPIARVPAASAVTHHLLSSHGPSSSSLALSFLHYAGCTPFGEPFEAVSTIAGPEGRGGRGDEGNGEAQAQGQPRDPTMSPMQPSLGPPRDEPTVFGLDKFNGDNFAEWSFKMENIFDHYDLLEVMEGTEKCPENDPEKSPWVRNSAQGYLLLGQTLGSSQIRHIKPFQRKPEKGSKAWAALNGVHAPATAAVAVVLERQMAALRIEEDEALQKKAKLLALLPESWSSLIINLNRDLPRLSLEDVKRAILQEDFRRRELAGSDAPRQQASARDMVMEGADDEEEEGLEAATTMEAAEVAAMAMTTRTMDALADGLTASQEGRGAGGGEEEAVEAVAVTDVALQNMKNNDKESESRDDRFPGQFFFVSTQAPAAPEKDESFEEPAAVEKVTLHSLDYWVMWGTIASAPFSNPTSAMGECDWLTLHRRVGQVALPILQQLVKNEMVAGIRVKGEPPRGKCAYGRW